MNATRKRLRLICSSKYYNVVLILAHWAEHVYQINTIDQQRLKADTLSTSHLLSLMLNIKSVPLLLHCPSGELQVATTGTRCSPSISEQSNMISK